MARSWHLPEEAANTVNPLAASLTQYPVLEALVSHLRPDDLVTLTTACQTINSRIRMHEVQAKANLLKKTLCPGVGLKARLSSHCPCKTRDWHQYWGCGGEGYDVDSHPCAECGINTCDECRAHVLYHVFMEDSGFDNHRWWAGFVLDNPAPFAIYPPKGSDSAAWHLPLAAMKSHHDQGRLHVPLQIDNIADPEPLDRILDTDLGRGYVAPYGRTTPPYEGYNLVSIFNMMARSRKEMLCPPCFEKHQEQGFAPCSCTYRKRFLDRWLCVPCQIQERDADEDLEKRLETDSETGHILSRKCRCDDTIEESDDYRAICNWCHGQINDMDNSDVEDNDDAKSLKDHEDDDDNAPATPTNIPPNHMGMRTNKDGTLSVFFNGKRISGERLSRGLITSWIIRNGVELPCTCCKCPIQTCQHGHGHNHDHPHDHNDGDNEEVEGADDDEVAEDADRESSYEEGAIDFDEDMKSDVCEEDE